MSVVFLSSPRGSSEADRTVCAGAPFPVPTPSTDTHEWAVKTRLEYLLRANMVSSKAKEEKISTISDPTRTQLPSVWAEEN